MYCNILNKFQFLHYFINIWMWGREKICKHKILVILTNVIFNALNVRTRACIPYRGYTRSQRLHRRLGVRAREVRTIKGPIAESPELGDRRGPHAPGE